MRTFRDQQHAGVNNDIDAGDVRAIVGGEEQGDVCDLLGLPESSQERPVEHMTCPAVPFVDLRPRRSAFDQARGDRVDADPVTLPPSPTGASCLRGGAVIGGEISSIKAGDALARTHDSNDYGG